MLLTVFLVLVLIAIALTVYHATSTTSPSPFPLWPAVFVLCLIELLRVIPLGKT